MDNSQLPQTELGWSQVVRLDLEDRNGHKAAAERVTSRFGRIDYLVNNAGRGQRALIEKTDVRVDQAIILPPN